ncbi:MAG TPA: hydrogenase expression/formation protein HypE [Kiritimatiellia bacterium]|nr:hydrogenase expression/formation protein HypE [Kiritimatiellia bacterium]
MNLQCPIPLSDYPVVTLAHGGGGSLMRRLIRDMFTCAFGCDNVQANMDSAILELASQRIAFTTDSFVVRPLFFPGGDIGALAINGTVNDLAMVGAEPRYLSCGMILEEGLSMQALWQIVTSMKHAADQASVTIVTGDTKVVDKGKGDGIFINTAGIGVFEHTLVIGPKSIKPGDDILVSGDIGRHGMAILCAREELALDVPIQSDCAPLNRIVRAMLVAGIELHALRDATRGGLASALIEMTDDAGVTISIREKDIPVREEVRGACELLGIDPLYVANEGCFVMALPAEQSDMALELLAKHGATGASPAKIGKVESNSGGRLILHSLIGAKRYLDLHHGEQLPRIC